MSHPRYILPVIVIAQFCCTSLWFASNAVMPELMTVYDLPSSATSYLTSSVQLGFIVGTLIFAVLSIVDRFAPSRVFLLCAILGGMLNLCTINDANNYASLLSLRFMTGLCLAGVYPVGMKIAADYYTKGLGRSLGYLVGALVLGTALPHLLKGLQGQLPWKLVIIATSILASIGGIAMAAFIPDGPYRKAGQRVDLFAVVRIFKVARFRSAAGGYFGHMWELYTFWAFVPLLLGLYDAQHMDVSFNIPLLSFLVIASGGIGCVLGGYVSEQLGTRRVAALALGTSGLCCLLTPVAFALLGPGGFVVYLLVWGMVVVADSPLFSTLVAQTAPPALKGTALTIVNSIGFALTIASIQGFSVGMGLWESPGLFMILAIGPALGLLALYMTKDMCP